MPTRRHGRARVCQDEISVKRDATWAAVDNLKAALSKAASVASLLTLESSCTLSCSAMSEPQALDDTQVSVPLQSGVLSYLHSC